MASPLAARQAWLAVGLMVGVWASLFAGMALARHAVGGTHAEDLGFTDQVIWNLLRGQWFRMSIYQGAGWNTEVNVAALARPDSLLAFHVEPMLLLFAPIYALGGDVRFLLALQALVLALGAVPAYRLGVRWVGTRWAGTLIAAVYLLSPLGQWAALADFHTTALAAPLLLLALERWAAGQSGAFVAAALLAMTAREDVALAVVGLGVVAAVRGCRRPGLLLVAVGLAAIVATLWIFVRYGSGGPTFAARYPELTSRPAVFVDALLRPEVRQYALTIWLGGGWLAWLMPLAVVPALPSLALNALSSSPWMAAGKAHYSALVLPFLVAGAAGGLGWVARRQRALAAHRVPGAGLWLPVAGSLLLLTSVVGYLRAGAGPLAANYAPVTATDHARAAAAIMAAIPLEAGISASSSFVPHLSRRARIYVFPAIEDADYVLLDVTASPDYSPGVGSE